MMKILSFSTCIMTATLLALGSSVEVVKAQLPNTASLDYCTTKLENAAQETVQAGVSGSYNPTTEGVGVSGTYGESSSRSSQESKNCDEVLKQAGRVTIAEVQANRDIAAAVINGEVDKAVIDSQIMANSEDAATRAYEVCLKYAEREINGFAICQEQYKRDRSRIESRDRFQRLNNSKP